MQQKKSIMQQKYCSIKAPTSCSCTKEPLVSIQRWTLNDSDSVKDMFIILAADNISSFFLLFRKINKQWSQTQKRNGADSKFTPGTC
jgi:hypothetical protein